MHGSRGISQGARKLAQTPKDIKKNIIILHEIDLAKKEKKILHEIDLFQYFTR